MNTLEGNKLIAEFMEFKTCKCVYNGESGRYYDYYAHPNFNCIQEQKIQIESEKGWGLVEQDFLFIEDLKFHTSWDWLMPVVEKIESLNLGTIKLDEDDMFRNANAVFRIEYKDVYIDLYGGMKKQDEWMEQTQFHSKLEATYKAVLEFIQWYNENK